MRALILHANNDYNVGDLLTYYGAKYLLVKALGGSQNLDVVQFDMMRAHDTESATYVSQYDWGNIDLIVLAGSPWIWNGCIKSKKYKLITDALQRWPKAKVVGLGIGSCFSKLVYDDMKFFNPEHFFKSDADGIYKSKLEAIFSRFNYVLVRDSFAGYILNHCNIDYKYSYDTSIFTHHKLGKKENQGHKKVLFFYDPTMGISKKDLGFDGAKYIDYQIDWALENKADVYCNSINEKGLLESRGVKVSFSVDLDFLSAKFVEYDEMLSGRVHMAILGFMSGIPKIVLFPVDTRFMTALKFGIDIKFMGEEFKYEKVKLVDDIWKDIQEKETIIIEEIKNAIR